ncbi:oxygenase MpaB family protein [Polymorphobacter megasporae]|nr:oxygenase MpaB family protein [Polymorphobacter megasporae]
MADPRTLIAGYVHDLIGSKSDTPGFVRVAAEPGLVPYGGAAWTVHGDFTAMMIGGVVALLTQMLHPVAAAGVWDHSNFRRDLIGRLKRTAQFIAGTTYGSHTTAGMMIDRVRRIHDHVGGTLTDGTPYSANDPAVLTWVHVAGADAFLRAYIRYRDPAMPGAAQDRYFAETAAVARALGATDVPLDRRGVAAYFQAVRPQLEATARSREIARILLTAPTPIPSTAPATRLMMEAGIDLLQPWAAAMHNLQIPFHRRPLVRVGARGVGAILRWSLNHERRHRPMMT